MALINPTLPTIGQPNSTEHQDVTNALTTIVAAFNGAVDSVNLGATAKVSVSSVEKTNSQVFTGSLADISGLSVVASPTVAVYYVAFMQLNLASSVGAERYVSALLDLSGTSVSRINKTLPASTQAQTGMCIALGSLAAGSHTFKGQAVGADAVLAASSAPCATRLVVVTFAQ